MRGCLKFLAGVTAVLFVVTAVFTLFFTNLFTVVANRDLLKESLTNLDQVIVETVPGLVVQTLEEQARVRGLAPVELDEATLQQATELLLPPGWIEAQTDTAVDTVYNLLEGGDLDNAQLEVDTSPLLERFRGQPGQAIVSLIVNGLPPCSQPTNPAELFSGNVTVPTCLPPEVPTEQITQEVHSRLVTAMEANPQLSGAFGVVRVSLFSPEQQAQNEELVQARAQLLRLQRIFAFMQNWGWLLWLLPVCCLLLIFLLAVRTWSEWGIWWGWPLAATAVIALFLSLIFPAIVTFMLRQMPTESVAIVTSMRQIGLQLVTAVSDTWLNRITVQAAIMLTVGIIFLLIGFLARSQTTKKAGSFLPPASN